VLVSQAASTCARQNRSAIDDENRGASSTPMPCLFVPPTLPPTVVTSVFSAHITCTQIHTFRSEGDPATVCLRRRVLVCLPHVVGASSSLQLHTAITRRHYYTTSTQPTTQAMTDVSPGLLTFSVSSAAAVALPAFPLCLTHSPPYTPPISVP
jgi:hypothetical protein